MRILSLAAFLLLSSVALAQLRLKLPNNELKRALENVLNNYSGGFTKIRGELVSSTPQSATYATVLQFSEAEENEVVLYGDNEAVSWSATMLTTEDYDAARKKYSTIYGEMKQMRLSLGAGNCRLVGKFGSPSESLRFVSTDFYLDPAAVSDRLQVRLSMEYQFPEWKVLLSVYEKEREDSEPPSPERSGVKKPVI